jgi:hypothetical protein
LKENYDCNFGMVKRMSHSQALKACGHNFAASESEQESLFYGLKNLGRRGCGGVGTLNNQGKLKSKTGEIRGITLTAPVRYGKTFPAGLALQP